MGNQWFVDSSVKQQRIYHPREYSMADTKSKKRTRKEVEFKNSLPVPYVAMVRYFDSKTMFDWKTLASDTRPVELTTQESKFLEAIQFTNLAKHWGYRADHGKHSLYERKSHDNSPTGNFPQGRNIDFQSITDVLMRTAQEGEFYVSNLTSVWAGHRFESNFKWMILPIRHILYPFVMENARTLQYLLGTQKKKCREWEMSFEELQECEKNLSLDFDLSHSSLRSWTFIALMLNAWMILKLATDPHLSRNTELMEQDNTVQNHALHLETMQHVAQVRSHFVSQCLQYFN